MNVTTRSLVLLATAACLLILGTTSKSQDAARTTWQDVRAALDSDGNGKVSSDELRELKSVAAVILKICNRDADPRLSAVELVEVREIASQADANKDDYVDLQELNQWLVAWRTQLSKQEQQEQKQNPKRESKNSDSETASEDGRISLKVVLDRKKNGFTDFDISNLTLARKTIMARFDTNRDKKLSAAELEGIKESLRDEDADGKGVTPSELTAWLAKWREELAEEPDEPSTVDPTQAVQGSKAKSISLAKLLDRKDNGLSAFDLANEIAAAKRILDKLDLDKNSRLSPVEMADVVEPLAEADVDRNQEVSRAELVTWIVAWRAKLP